MPSKSTLVSSILTMLVANAAAECVPSEMNICMSVDLFASETGYYNLDRGDFEDTEGSSPPITVKIGQTITFDQTDVSNWYHPVGFAYAPDGAHGDDWGADENPEVEGLGELEYKIDGAATTCEDKGDTGLDCYEPEFFYPLGDWEAKEYTSELTVTQDVADAAKGGVLYYFCHIHSKMSGKIQIVKEDGTPIDSGSDELELYDPIEHKDFDATCGTTAVTDHAKGGSKDCGIKFFPGDHTTQYEQCLQAIDCQMHWDMYTETSKHDDKIVSFMQQMIPHHQNAVNMAKLLLKHADQSDLDNVEDLEGILRDIINTQNFQIHQFRNYLNPENNYLDASSKGLTPPHIENDNSAAFGHVTQAFMTFFSVAVTAYMLI